MQLSAEDLARWAAIIAAVGTMISDAEMVVRRRALAPGGVFDWELVRTSRPWTAGGPLSRPITRAIGYYGSLSIAGLQFGCAAVLVANVDPSLTAPLLGAMLASHLLLHFRYQLGLDGADQMRSVVLAGLLVFYAAPGQLASRAGLIFIAAQAILSYFTSGYAKLISPVWRHGEAVSGILSTKTYGDPTGSAWIMNHSYASLFLCWGTIVFECWCPLLVFAGVRGCLLFIVLGVGFHGFIAVGMGLNDFFWTFTATYPALLYLSGIVPHV